jgi:glutamyl-tRNA synthetase
VVTHSSAIRVRFAPSPTGHLHIGSFRTAVFNWLFARHHKGVFLLRIEDTDLERSKPEYFESILGSIAWAGFDPDEPLVIQSERLPEHTAIINALVEKGRAYRCYCLGDEIELRYNEQNPGDMFVKYDGHCRNKKEQPGKPFVIRFALPTDRTEVSFNDLIRGTVTVPMNQMDDFIIARSDGRPIYNFVVVADDAFMRITHVIRGEDHISNTPKQILLYEACNFTIPQFAHVPLILGPSGEKLSKRDGATSALEYKLEGFLPEALLNYLARLGWAHGDQEVFTLEELVNYFSLEAIGKKGAIFDPQKLRWLNGVYIRQKSGQELLTYILTYLDVDFKTKCKQWNDHTIALVLDLYKERATTVCELMHAVLRLHDGPLAFEEQDLQTWIKPETLGHLALAHALLAEHDRTLEELTTATKELAKKLDVKLVVLAQPLRIAIQGVSSGPGVFELLDIVGRDESMRRIQSLMNKIASAPTHS